jgi:hypothetical protein
MHKYLLTISLFLFSFTQEQPYEVSITSTSASVLFYQTEDYDIRFSLLFRGVDARSMMNMYLDTGKPVRSTEAIIVITREFHDGTLSYVVTPEEYKVYKGLGLSILKLKWEN